MYVNIIHYIFNQHVSCFAHHLGWIFLTETALKFFPCIGRLLDFGTEPKWDAQTISVLIWSRTLSWSLLLLFTVEDSANLPPSPPPSPAAEHFGPLDQGRLMLHVCMERGEVRNTMKELEHFFSHEYSSHPLTLAWMRVFYLGTPASPTPSRLISTLSQCPTDAHAPLICGAGPKIDGVVFAGTTLPPLLTSFKSISSSSSSIFSS